MEGSCEVLFDWLSDLYGLEGVYCVPRGVVVWHSLASAMLRLAWPLDMLRSLASVVAHSRSLAPLSSAFDADRLQMAQAPRQHAEEAEAPFLQYAIRSHGLVVKKFAVEHLIRVVMHDRFLKTARHAGESLDVAIRFAFPGKVLELKRELEVANCTMPSRSSLMRARVRLGAASLLQRRREGCAGYFYYLTYDKSPQRIEIFAAREWAVSRERPRHCWTLRFPYASVSHGRSGLIDVAMSLVHMIFLVAGPSLAGMQLYSSMVRSCVTDMGLEWDLAEVPDCTAVYFKDWVNEEDVEAARGSFPFPLAIRLPGPSHIMDCVLKLLEAGFLFL